MTETERTGFPLLAGMTKWWDAFQLLGSVGFGLLFRAYDRHSRAGGNLEFQCLKNLSEKTKTLPPSFPRKWESRNEKQQDLSEMTAADWIPAFAGMTGF
ncbi:hypothetical protein ACVWQG_10265 [Neisseria meningitidis]